MKQVGYVILVFATLYLAVLYNSPAIVFLAGVELLLPLFLFLLLLVGDFLLRVSFGETFCLVDSGEGAALKLCFSKRGLLPLGQVRFRIRGRNRTTGEKLRLREQRSVDRGVNPVWEIPLPALESGVWHFSLKRLRVYDYIRLSVLPHPYGGEAVCVVLPRCIPLAVNEKERSVPVLSQEEASLKPSWAYDRAERGDLRAYRPGDSLKEIHWKLSAKRDELLVWEQQRTGQGGWLLGLEISGMDRRKAELVYSLLVSMYRQLGSGAVLFGQRGEVCLLSLTVEKELDLAMARLLEGELFLLEEAEALPAASLWVKEPLSLWQGQQCLQEFVGLSEEAWEDTLNKMELTL